MIIALSGLTEDPQGNRGSANSGKDTVADHLVEKYGFAKVALADPMKRFCMEVFGFSEDQLWGPSEKRNEPDNRYLRGFRLDCGCLADGWNRVNNRSTKWWVYSVLETCEEHAAEPEWYRGHLFPDPTPPKEYLTPRHALQQLGTEWGRNCYNDVWVDYCLREVRELLMTKPPHENPTRPMSTYDRTCGLRFAVDSDPVVKGVVIPDVRFKNELAAIKKVGKVVRVTRSGAGLEGEAGRHQSESEQEELSDDDFDFIIANNGTKHALSMMVDQMMAVFSGRIIPYDDEQKDTPPFLRE